VYLVYPHAGAIWASLRQVGWGFLLYLPASFVVYVIDTWGWRLVLADTQPPVGFWRLFSIRMAGEAVNRVTPLASMGGEPLKAYLLVRGGWSTRDALASVFVSKNAMTLGQIAFIFAGVALAAPKLHGNRGVIFGLVAFPASILIAIIITAVLDIRIRWRGKQAQEAGGGERSHRSNAVMEMWAQIADFIRDHPVKFGLSFLYFFVGWAAGCLELLAASRLLGFPLSVMDALMMEAILVTINMSTFLIPGNAGTQEGGFTFVAGLFGLAGPQGLALSVLRRLRDVIWVGFGLCYLAVVEGRVLFRPNLEPTPPVALSGESAS